LFVVIENKTLAFLRRERARLFIFNR